MLPIGSRILSGCRCLTVVSYKTARKLLRRFRLCVPSGTKPDGTLFVAIQHPRIDLCNRQGCPSDLQQRVEMIKRLR